MRIDFRLLAVGLVALALLRSTAGAQATPIFVSNPSFESGTSTTLTNWTVSPAAGTTYSQAGIDTNPANEFFTGYTGSATGFVYWAGTGIQGTADVSQTLGVSAQSSTTYTLSVDIGYRDDATGYPHTLPAPQSIAVELFAGASELSGGIYLKPTLVYRNFVTYTSTYTVGAVAPVGLLQVQLIGTRTSPSSPPPGYNPLGHVDANESIFAFDNVRLDGTSVAVPEPTSLVLASLGAIGSLIFVGRKLRTRRLDRE